MTSLGIAHPILQTGISCAPGLGHRQHETVFALLQGTTLLVVLALIARLDGRGSLSAWWERAA